MVDGDGHGVREALLSRHDVAHELAVRGQHVYPVVRVVDDEDVAVDVAADPVRLKQMVGLLSARRAVAGHPPPGRHVEHLHVRRHPVRHDDAAVSGGAHVVGVGEQVASVVALALQHVLQRAGVRVVELQPPHVAVDHHESPVLVDVQAARVLVVTAQCRDVATVGGVDLDLLRAAVAHGDVAVSQHAHVEGTAERRAAVAVAAPDGAAQRAGRVEQLHAAVLAVEHDEVAARVDVDARRVHVLHVRRPGAAERADHLRAFAARRRRHRDGRVRRLLADGLHRLAVEGDVVHVHLAEDAPDGVERRRAGGEVDAQLGVDGMRGEVRGHLEAVQDELADVEDLLRAAEVQELGRDGRRALQLLERVAALRVAQVGALALLVHRRHQRVDHHQLLLVHQLV